MNTVDEMNSFMHALVAEKLRQVSKPNVPDMQRTFVWLRAEGEEGAKPGGSRGRHVDPARSARLNRLLRRMRAA